MDVVDTEPSQENMEPEQNAISNIVSTNVEATTSEQIPDTIENGNSSSDFLQPNASTSSTSNLQSEQSPKTSESEHTSVEFPKLKFNVKNRYFRRKNKIDSSSDDSDDDNEVNRVNTTNKTSSDEDSSTGSWTAMDTLRPNDFEANQADVLADVTVRNLDDEERERVSLNNDNSTDMYDTGTDDSTMGSLTSDNNGELFEKICNPKLNQNWFAIRETMQRQQGYSSKLQGHLQFQQRYYGSLHAAQRFELMYMLKYHDGCVNALGFNPTGNYLASASDDLRVVIWDWAIGERKTSWVTKHRNNVFQSKFLSLSGQSELQLVTSARDGQVWLWQLGQDGLRGSKKLGQHKGPCHKLTLLKDQPHVILSCGEDALIYSHDVRELKPNKLTTVLDEKKSRIALYSIHSHPLNSNEFCVCGQDPTVFVYDQRYISKERNTVKTFKVSSNKMRNRHITACMYNYCGSEIVASYNDEDIYLFDTTTSESNYVHCYQGHRNGATIKGVNFFGPKSEYVISGSDCGNIFFWDKSSQGIIQFLLADKGVVNCLEPHPSMPILASSGLDSDVKIWVPSREMPNEMDGLLKTVTENMRVRDMSEHENSHIMLMLWRVIQGAHRNHVSHRRQPEYYSDHPLDEVDNEDSSPSSDSNLSDSAGAENEGDVECFPS